MIIKSVNIMIKPKSFLFTSLLFPKAEITTVSYTQYDSIKIIGSGHAKDAASDSPSNMFVCPTAVLSFSS